MPPLGIGRIVWTVYPGNRGDGKRRPMVILTNRMDVARTGRAFVVICSTSFEEPIKANEVLLPSKADGKCGTGLTEPTVAVCDWTDNISIAGIRTQDVGGVLPVDLVKTICAKVGIPFKSDRG